MHLLYIYQFYNNPDCPATARHYSYFRHLGQRHHITLITSRAYQDQRITHDFDWVPEGVTLHALDVPYDNAMTARQRLQAYAGFAIRALVTGLRCGRPDLIVGVSTPLSAAWAASRLATLKRVPWVFELNDLWPDFPIQMGAIRSPWLQNQLYRSERTLYRKAAHIITRSVDMEAHVLRQRIPQDRVTTIVNGSDLDLLAACSAPQLEGLRAAHDLTGTFVVLYGGTFGRANDIPTLLQAAERLAHRDEIRFVFAGYGFHEPLVREAAARSGNILLLPPQPRHTMLCWYRLADLSLVPFIDKPVLKANSPAKFFDSLAAGTPVVVTNAGWTKRFVETHRCGWYIPPSDPAALAARIEWLVAHPEERAEAGQRGAEIARGHFDRALLVQQVEAILERAAATRGT